jgi:hypothetical protein
MQVNFLCFNNYFHENHVSQNNKKKSLELFEGRICKRWKDMKHAGAEFNKKLEL